MLIIYRDSGFLECYRYIPQPRINAFLNDVIKARIGTRVLAEHHLALYSQHYGHDKKTSQVPSEAQTGTHESTESPVHGIIHLSLRPYSMIKACAAFVSDLCEATLGMSCPVHIHMEDPQWGFTYIPVHLEYIMIEILKNSMRANVEMYKKRIMSQTGPASSSTFPFSGLGTPEQPQSKEGPTTDSLADIPPVLVTVALDSATKDVTIRVRDQGGGIPYADLERVFDYSYTTVRHQSSPSSPSSDTAAGGAMGPDASHNILSISSEKDMQRGIGGQLAGLGYGLPTARVYAEYFGGSLQLVSLVGWGTDTFIRLKNIYPSFDKEI